MEQRQTSRHWVAQPMSCVGQGGHHFVGQLVNLSQTGMMVLADEALATDHSELTDAGSQVFSVLFSDGRGGTGKIQLEADTVWCESSGEDRRYMIGFSLKPLSGPKRMLINHWVKYLTH